MDPDKLAATLVITAAVFAWGVMNRGWTRGWTQGWTSGPEEGGHPPLDTEQPSSQAPPDEQEPPEPVVSTPIPLRTPPPLNGPLTPPGPLPPREDPTEVQQRQPYETRIRWARRQLDAGLLTPGEIDTIGADLWGVDRRTVRRWRKECGDDRPDDADTKTTPARERTP